MVWQLGCDYMTIGIAHASCLPWVVHCDHDVATAREILDLGDVFRTVAGPRMLVE